MPVERGELAAEHEMQKLLRGFLSALIRLYPSRICVASALSVSCRQERADASGPVAPAIGGAKTDRRVTANLRYFLSCREGG